MSAEAATRTPSLASRVIGAFGRFCIVASLSIYRLFTRPPRLRRVLVEMVRIGYSSLTLIVLSCGVLGAISVYFEISQVDKLMPDYSLVGPVFLQIMFRELAPVVTGVMVAARVGSGIAAEIGTMQVTEQLDALVLSNIDPIDHLVVPKVAASIPSVVMLGLVGAVVASWSGMKVAEIAFGILPATFLNFSFTHLSDLVICIIKSALFGLVVPVVSVEEGFKSRGGATGVGTSAMMAVVTSAMIVILIDFIVGAIAHLTGYL